MRKTAGRRWFCRAAGMAASICMIFGAIPAAALMAEEYEDAEEFWSEDNENVNDLYLTEEGIISVSPESDGAESDKLTGTYTVDSDWVKIPDESDDDKTLYRRTGCEEQTETSTISCSYLDTNYSVLEYEKLRDMLTNNLLYSNVNAQISASAVYTDAKDCLYILIADDSSEVYRELYYYVVGDYRCFCVEVREYRQEAEALKAAGEDTPGQSGQKTAQKFVWNKAG